MGKALFLAFVLALPAGFQQSADVTARFNRAVELQRQGALKEAAAEYRALLAIAPNYAEAQANLGAVLARLGNYEEAVTSYEAALRLNPSLTPILLNLGIAHYRAGQFARVVDPLERFLATAPDNLQARQLLGISLVELGRDAEAVRQLELTLAAGSDDLTALHSLGMAYLRLRRPELQAIIKRLAASSAGLPLSHLLAGQALLDSFEFQRAADQLEAAAKLNPELPRLQFSLGLSYLKLGRSQEAVVCLERELRRTPRDFAALYYLAYIEEMNGNLQAARQRIDAALKVEPQSPEANTLLGKILFKQGKAAEAVAPLEAAVAKEPDVTERRYLLARVYQQLGRRQDANREFAAVQRLKAQDLEREKPRTKP